MRRLRNYASLCSLRHTVIPITSVLAEMLPLACRNVFQLAWIAQGRPPRKLCRDDQDKAERLIVETGRVFEDVIAESSRTGAGAAWCIEDRKGHRKVIQLMFLHGPDVGVACCVEEFVSERGLSLAETAR